MSTDCPTCGSHGRIARIELPDLYRCTNWKCRAEYFVQRKRCGACNEEIDDDNEYCHFHAYLGNDAPAPRREDFCTVCLNPVAENSEYCAAHERQFREEQEEYLKKFEQEVRDSNK